MQWMDGHDRCEPDVFSARKVAHVPEAYHVPGLMTHPRMCSIVDTTMYPLPANGVPVAVGSEPCVVVLVGSCWGRLGGYRMPRRGQLEIWPSCDINEFMFHFMSTSN